MPEEINRVLTDRLSDLLLTHSPEAAENLDRPRASTPGAIHYVGNTMIDSLRRARGKRPRPRRLARPRRDARASTCSSRSTGRRTSTTRTAWPRSSTASPRLGGATAVVFPIHPRTRARLAEGAGLERLEAAGVRCIDPAGYVEFLSLQAGRRRDRHRLRRRAGGGGRARRVVLHVPHRTPSGPSRSRDGTNVLLGDDPALIADVRPSPLPPTPCAIPLWDGHAGERTADALMDLLVARSEREAAGVVGA